MSTKHAAEPLTLYFDQETLSKKQMGEALLIVEQLFGARLQIVETELIPPDTDTGSGHQLGEWIYRGGDSDSPSLTVQPYADP